MAAEHSVSIPSPEPRHHRAESFPIVRRYRVVTFDFDSRALLLGMQIDEGWEEQVKDLHRHNKEQIVDGLIEQFGRLNIELKVQNFIDLGPAPFSIIAYHNKFFGQIRHSFVVGAYYPALTGSCALGERILNYLILSLRGYYRRTPEYKSVYRNASFDNWKVPIDALRAWGVLLPKAAEGFEKLWTLRKEFIHFRPGIETNDRQLALDCIQVLSRIIVEQFPGDGPQPWFIQNAPGVSFIKKEAEEWPFVREVYLPNSFLVSPYHYVDSQDGKFIVRDDTDCPDRRVSDDEFVRVYTESIGKRVVSVTRK